ncbi:phage tail tape measure protein [Phocaeicola vulgatus]|jgi:TP901 family phage tail tape measure protein|uniref:phage tail tape measure protein n=1 Tax=Phocaeicola vulgatus TaxID=821 RepID=UPI0023072396|nr:phage tail tape measure protein [Phocaeicola vulgatus]MDB0731995.1 phage tail tape measure protein [Phocaeicola vulgatus]MDB0740810.1 phage tail tape measure protein [Phocaeicola vulgatus]MDB0747466.1 phage tail tape measure protein [Phocaeicola vulgatus]MDB0755532.1 phage tail tape measure protein [Phocaeicola vulgatus]
MAIHEKATVELQVNGEQARKEMQLMEQHALSLKARIVEAQNAGDTKKVKQLQKELKETNTALRAMRDNARNIDAAMNNIGLATPKELRRLLKDINAKLNSGHIARGSEEWKKYQAQLKLVNAEIRKVNDEIKESEGWLTRFNNGFAKWGALAASGIAAITGISMTLNKMRKDRDDKEASAANLKALTGLDDASIQWLARQAEILSTSMHKSGLRVTQSSKEILEAYMLVGSAKPDLLGNKEALNAVTIEAMRLSKAAKMDLKEAVDAVTLSMNQYGASSEKAADYANVMAAGSKYGSAAVQSITAAVTKAGVSASTANVPIEQLVGSIETLAEKGIVNEVAGTGLKMFFLRLQTGADETNPKIVGLQTALKNLQKLSTEEIVKRFGAETYTVAQTLIDGADKVEYYTKAVTGTNVAMEQAAINSETNEARLAQLKNKIRETGIELMEKLNPSLNMLTGWTTKLLSMAPALIDWLVKYKGALASTCVTLFALIAYKKADVAWSKLQVVWNEKIVASLLSLGKFVKANPYAFLAVGVAALIGRLIDLKREQNRVTESQKSMLRISNDLNDKYGEQESKIRLLTNVIHNQNFSYNERRRCIDELKQIVPGYNGMLNEEGKLMNDNTGAIKDYLVQLEKQIKLEAAREELAGLYREQRKTEKLERKQQEEVKRANANFNAAQFMASARATSLGTQGTRALAKATDASTQQARSQLTIANQELNKTQARLDQLNQAIKDVNAEIAASDIQPDVVKNDGKNNGGGTLTEGERSKAKKDALVKEEKEYLSELTHLKQLYIDSDLMTQEEYARLVEDLEMQHLNRQLDIAGMEPDEIEKINQKILDAQIKFKERCRQEDDKEYKEAQQRALTAREKRYQLDVEAAARYHYQNLTSEEDYLQVLSDLEYGYYSDMLANYQLTEQQKADFQKQINANRLKEDEREYQKRKEAQDKERALAQKYTDMAKGIAEDYGQTLGEMIANGELTMKSFLRETLLMAVDALEKVIEIAAVEITAKNAAATAPLSFIGIAKAAAQIAAIKVAFAAVKGMIGNFYTGGFTGPGEWDRPQGIVHSNEFVANRFAVANPAIRPVLNLIDHAQRTNTVGSLTASDVSAVVAPSAVVPVSEGGTGVDLELHRLVVECAETMKKVKSRLQEPLVAETYVTGKHGINQAQKEYNRLNNNKSRNKL